ncbi:transketolase [Zavarzinella formosa]|uniref:transketolase n=1 Tax=Zavarzinella formosa TaxID=360055 RepID=UPI0002ED8B40|nr:transketolase [Zavarzinella formosa]
MPTSIDQLCINTIRTLSMDAVQQANSGHPGTPMALAPVAYTLWQEFLNYDPTDPTWANRDRFVLSVGHASMLVYSLIHLTGIPQLDKDLKPTGEPAVSLDDIKRFRQLNSRTPGHPESHITSGLETTTGPLSQGLGNSVGMAIAGRWFAANYNKPKFELFDYKVFALCGDGCMMEGLSSEAASLAGHLKLSNLVWLYDDNHITIDGRTTLSFSEDVGKRFEGYGWNVLHVADANNTTGLAEALTDAKLVADKPTLIIVKSIIGYGAPKKQDQSDAHGAPLGEEEIKGAKKFYGWPEDQKFLVPDGVKEHFQELMGARGKKAHANWDTLFADYKKAYPELATQLEQIHNHELPAGWDKDLPVFPADPKGLATRESGGKVINALAKNYPWLIGGSADLAKSTLTTLKFEGAGELTPTNPGGRNMHFGIREHAMSSVLNGLALSGLRPFGSGFLIFSDYAKPAIRLGALMEIPTIHVFTHDSIGVGEDGPTHQPIEQLASLRTIPNMIVFRPGDANEVTEAWRAIAQLKHNPACLALSRQAMATLDRTKYAPASGLAKGAYVLADNSGGDHPAIILMASGSEVGLVVEAYEKLVAEGVKARVVSVPSMELFDQQPKEYRDSVLPPAVRARVSVEMASKFGWDRYVGLDGVIIGMHGFGNSAPVKDLVKYFGFTLEKVLEGARTVLGR